MNWRPEGASLGFGPRKKRPRRKVAEPLLLWAMPAWDQAAAGARTFVIFRRWREAARGRIVIRATKIDAMEIASTKTREVFAQEKTAQAACAAVLHLRAEYAMTGSSFSVLYGTITPGWAVVKGAEAKKCMFGWYAQGERICAFEGWVGCIKEES